MQCTLLDGVAMALPENAGTVEELLVGEQDPDAQLRVSQWQHFKRHDYMYTSSTKGTGQLFATAATSIMRIHKLLVAQLLLWIGIWQAVSM